VCAGDPGVHPAEGSTGLTTRDGAIEWVDAVRCCRGEAGTPKLMAPDQLRRGVLLADDLCWGELVAELPARMLATTAEAIVLPASISTTNGTPLAVQRGPALKP
jgi:hypothetical protein